MLSVRQLTRLMKTSAYTEDRNPGGLSLLRVLNASAGERFIVEKMFGKAVEHRMRNIRNIL